MTIARIMPVRATLRLGLPVFSLLPNFNLDAMKNSNLILFTPLITVIICKNNYFFFITAIFSFILFLNLLILHSKTKSKTKC